VTHHCADGRNPEVQLPDREQEDLPPSMYPDPEIARYSLVYRVKEEVTYSVIIEELIDGEWVPFEADDVQLELVMLDPYIRTGLAHDGRGKFSKTFMVPDVYGVYKFRVMYRRVGYSVIKLENQVSIRPFRHNEYERFIPSAFPYYASAFSMMAGFFVLGVVFLFTKE